MRTVADENYLKEIYLLGEGQNLVSTSTLADQLGVADATVTGMLKKLSALDLVNYQPYQGVQLTESGKKVALKVIRRHRLLETFLVQTLGIPWERVHDEAEHLEHALSDYLEHKLDEFLGQPTSNPHGSPIPNSQGEMSQPHSILLADLTPGNSARVLEINDHDPDLLIYLEHIHLIPGTKLQILSVNEYDRIMTISTGGRELILGPNSTHQIYVSPE